MIKYNYEKYPTQSLIRATVVTESRNGNPITSDIVAAHHADDDLILKLWDYITAFESCNYPNPNISAVAWYWKTLLRQYHRRDNGKDSYL